VRLSTRFTQSPLRARRALLALTLAASAVMSAAPRQHLYASTDVPDELSQELAAPAEVQEIETALTDEPADAVAGALTLTDDFENPFAGLLLRLNASRGSVHAVQGYEAGEYVMRKSDPRTVAPSVVQALPGDHRNGSVSADVRLVGETQGRYVSLGCRLNMEETAGYMMEVRPHDRSFRLLRRDPSRAAPTVLADWQASGAIRSGVERNRLTLTCAGDAVTLGANGTDVLTVKDATYGSGRFTLAAGADRSTGVTWEARWDNLVFSTY
jgi:hypothetical protein